MSKSDPSERPGAGSALGLVAVGAVAISWAAPLVKVIEAAPSTIGYYRLLFAALSLVPVALFALRLADPPSDWIDGLGGFGFGEAQVATGCCGCR